MNDRLNTTLVENCLQYLPEEYFIMSLSVIAALSFLVFLLSVTTALLALRRRKSLFRKERTWITALDFIGGIGGVDSIFESYETFLGKNRSQLEELRREHSEIRRRFSSPYIRRDHLRGNQRESGKRSNSNFETTRRRTLKEVEEEDAKFCIEILHNPEKYYQNLPQPARRESDGIVNLVMRRFSVTSVSAESLTPPPPPPPARNPDSRQCRPPSPIPTRKFIKKRSGSLDAGQARMRTSGGSPVNRITTLARKKPSVIPEVIE